MSFMQTNAIDVKQIEVGRRDRDRYWPHRAEPESRMRLEA